MESDLIERDQVSTIFSGERVVTLGSEKPVQKEVTLLTGPVPITVWTRERHPAQVNQAEGRQAEGKESPQPSSPPRKESDIKISGVGVPSTL